MTIYFARNNLFSDFLPSYEQIGFLAAKATSGEDSATEALEKLGVDPTDASATTTMKALLTEVAKEGVEVVLDLQATASLHHEDEDATGVYFIQNAEQERIAVFKAGNKRACIELLARRIANMLGLPFTAAAGSLAVCAEPPGLVEAKTSVELWNGKVKSYALQPSPSLKVHQEVFQEVSSR